MPSSYKITPVDRLPSRRQGTQGNVYRDILDDVIKSGTSFAKIDVPGRKPASIAAGLKDAISRDARRYSALTVHRRGDQVYLERRERGRQRVTEKKAA